MTKSRLLQFLVGPELGLASTLLFVGLYTWPFLTFTRASATFQFTFVVWCLQILLIAARGHASARLESQSGPDASPTLPPAE